MAQRRSVSALSAQLLAFRDEFSLSQRDVARELGVTQAAYNQIERGGRRPSIDLAKKIGALTGLKPAMIVGLEAFPASPRKRRAS